MKMVEKGGDAPACSNDDNNFLPVYSPKRRDQKESGYEEVSPFHTLSRLTEFYGSSHKVSPEEGAPMPNDNISDTITHVQIFHAVGVLTGQVNELARGVERLHEDVNRISLDAENRCRDLEREIVSLRIMHGESDGKEKRDAVIRGVLLTVFGGASGAALINAIAKIRPFAE